MTTFSALQCPVCGRPVEDPAPPACLTCGLPSVGPAARVITRIGVTLREIAADRDALLGTLRAAAPGPARQPVHTPAPTRPAPAWQPGPAWQPPGPAPEPIHWMSEPPPPPRPRRRLSPQEVLLGLGALLLVAAAIAFVAVAWTRLGVGFQAGVMSVVTALACGASAWTARRGLRATEEALAAAGIALLAIDLAAVRGLGLFSLQQVPLRTWTAVSCLVVVAAGVLLGRLTRSTTTWPLAALLAVQPVPFLLLPDTGLEGAPAVAAALGMAAVNLVVTTRRRAQLRTVGVVLTAGQAFLGVAGGLLVSAFTDSAETWAATALLAAAGLAAVAGTRLVPDLLPRADVVAGAAAAVTALAATLSWDHTSPSSGREIAAGLGLALLTLAVLLDGRRTAEVAAWAGGGTAAVAGAALLAGEVRWASLAALALAAVVPSVLAAVRRPALRSPATGAAMLAAGSSVVLAHAADLLAATTAGLLLALVGAVGFGVATLRAGRPEERVAAVGAVLAGLAAGGTSGTVDAWGQVGLQLAVVGAAAAGYALVAARREVMALAVADLVVAAWIALAGADVTTPEAYTLPAAVGLLLLALPRVRAGAPSWTAEGVGLAVALAPSAMVVVADPTALRLVLVVVAAALVTVMGTSVHRRAPFVIGATTLAFLAVGLLGPEALALPRWLTLGTVGLLLLVVGATYEQRRQQAREAVVWVAQMR